MEILIVEDDRISRLMLKKMLLEMGHDVHEAHDGKQAWELLQQHKCRFVITDWKMPEMDGLELCRRIRQTADHGYIYIIMLTAKDSKKDLVKVLQSGADDYIAKPFDPEELRARVLTGIRVLNLEDSHTKLQNTLLESRNKLRIVFDSLQEFIVALDPLFNVVSANKAFVNITGFPSEEIVGKNCQELSDGSDILRTCISEIKTIAQEVFIRGKARHALVRGQDKEGTVTYHQVACLPIKDDHGKTFQLVVVFKDITEDRRKTEKIQALNERLEAKNVKMETTLKRLEDTQAQMLQSEKMASIGQLAAGVAHEINNPTGFVSSNLKTLSDYHQDIEALFSGYRELVQILSGSPDQSSMPSSLTEKIEALIKLEKDIDIDYVMEDLGELIKDCRDGTNRIKKIVLDLKDFAHPGEDKIQSTDINKGLESTLNVVNNELKYKAKVHKDFGDIPTVYGYPQQLNQVFMNILVNAGQAIENRGEIYISTSSADGYVEISIRDTGCGIPEENLNRIFDPFFTTKDVGKGTGLGMNIAYNIIKKHNGTIDVQSTVGQGTTFTICIPSKPADGTDNKTDSNLMQREIEKEQDGGA